MKVIHASKTYCAESPGVPIAYVFRNLTDNLLAAVTQTTSYSISTPVRIKQKVKVAIKNMMCTISDDEGPGNLADMDRWKISVAGFNVKKRDGTSDAIPPQTIYEWATPGEVSVRVGDVWQEAINRSAIITFETDPALWDFEARSQLVISGYGREYDSSSANEHGWGSITLTGGNTMYGTHKFSISSADFSYLLTVDVTPA